jgi:hypothetical protein
MTKRVSAEEEALVRAFIVPERRARYLDKLASPKARQEFMARHFHHMKDLDPRFARRIDPHRPLVEWEKRHDAHIEQILQLLRNAGASDRCYVISASSDLDGQETNLEEALYAVVGWNDGTFISCVPGKLAYFEGEELNERYILQR